MKLFILKQNPGCLSKKLSAPKKSVLTVTVELKCQNLEHGPDILVNLQQYCQVPKLLVPEILFFINPNSLNSKESPYLNIFIITA